MTSQKAIYANVGYFDQNRKNVKRPIENNNKHEWIMFTSRLRG